jgi:hypothetical protein
MMIWILILKLKKQILTLRKNDYLTCRINYRMKGILKMNLRGKTNILERNIRSMELSVKGAHDTELELIVIITNNM